jgi:hypothetical protein
VGRARPERKHAQLGLANIPTHARYRKQLHLTNPTLRRIYTSLYPYTYCYYIIRAFLAASAQADAAHAEAAIDNLLALPRRVLDGRANGSAHRTRRRLQGLHDADSLEDEPAEPDPRQRPPTTRNTTAQPPVSTAALSWAASRKPPGPSTPSPSWPQQRRCAPPSAPSTPRNCHHQHPRPTSSQQPPPGDPRRRLQGPDPGVGGRPQRMDL